jgi:hypothetical protein
MEKTLAKAIENLLANSENKSKWDSIKLQQDEIAATFSKLKEESPEYYIPLRLACSVYLTYGAKNSNLILPYIVSDFQKAWLEIKPMNNETSVELAKRFEKWLNGRKNYRFSKKSGMNFAHFFENFDPVKEIEIYKSCNSKKELKKFWMRFEGVGPQYSKNLCMDEQNIHFVNSIKIDSRLNSLLKGTQAEKYSDSEKELLFLNAAKTLGLTGWEVDRICFNFRNEIKDLIK